MKDKVRRAVLDFLQIESAREQVVRLYESVGFAGNVIRNRVWYRGDPSELSQLAKQLAAVNGRDDVAASRFWAQVPELGSVRKAHTGLPAVMADTLSYIVKADRAPLTFADPAADARWRALAEENSFDELVGRAITETLVTGDGAFKISVDPAVSAHPILSFWPADRVEYEQRRGRITAVVFLTRCAADNGKTLTLRERYAPGEVAYTLWDQQGRAVPLEGCGLPGVAGLRDVHFDPGVMLAVPLKFFESTRFAGRGRSIYDSKTDAFDALDEIMSQWIDAVRAGRVLRYIPDDLIPRSAADGSLTRPGYFTSNFIVTGHSNKETAQSMIEMQQAEIRYEAFSASYEAALELCLQGILSPATLGLQVSRVASAAAQRERKDVTGYTRGAMTGALEKILPRVALALLAADDLMLGRAAARYAPPGQSFGEYGAPDFETRVQTLATARGAGLMSVQTAVQELWGGSRTKAELEQEVQRLSGEPPK